MPGFVAGHFIECSTTFRIRKGMESLDFFQIIP